jgi:membrane protease YdiL (CAAX protease family)
MRSVQQERDRARFADGIAKTAISAHPGFERNEFTSLMPFMSFMSFMSFMFLLLVRLLAILLAMIRRSLALLLVALTTPLAAQTWLDPYRPVAQQLIKESQSSDFAWQRLAELTDTFGHRLSGSVGLEKAIDWAVAKMQEDGLENVRKEPVMVPKWVRGRESLELIEPIAQSLPMLGLGNSVGTPATGVEADVLVVNDFNALTARAADAKGKIVLFNARFTNYGETVAYRGNGPSRAAAVGAVAALVRSVGPIGLRTPHTGATNYATGDPQIPAAAISAEDADRFERLQARGVRIRVQLMMEARFEPDAQSYNVVGEWRGREFPNEIVLVGGHFDSWDVGTGASDDGGGCVVTWEALRLMKKLNLRPRRTVRVVLRERLPGCARLGARQSRAAARVGRRRLRPGRLRLFRSGTWPRDRSRDRRSLEGDRRRPDPLFRRRRRHHPVGPRRQHPDDVARRERRLLSGAPHAGRHYRAHYAEADERQRRGDCGHGVRNRRFAVAIRREVIGVWPIVVTYLLVRAFWLTLERSGRLLDSPIAPGLLKLVLWAVPCLILTMAISRLSPSRTWREFGFGRGLRTGLLFGIATTLPMAAAALWAGIKASGMAELVGVSLLDPIGESVLFSGFLFSQLRRWHWKVVPAFSVSALLFGLAHSDGGELDLIRIVYYGRFDILGSHLRWLIPALLAGAAGGLMFTWLFYRWGTLWPVIAFHAAINFWWTLSGDRTAFVPSIWSPVTATAIAHGIAMALAIWATLRLTRRPGDLRLSLPDTDARLPT